jgi:hypothetical protein
LAQVWWGTQVKPDAVNFSAHLVENVRLRPC